MKTIVKLTALILIFFASQKVSAEYAWTNYVGTAGTSSGTYYTNIQDALDESFSGDLVLVSNGVYNAGGRAVSEGLLKNRVLIEGSIAVISVSGPEKTFIVGAPDPTSLGNGPDAFRCAYLASGSLLSGFTLSNGYTQTSGDGNANRGGAGALLRIGGTISNCIVECNTAHGYGGGVNCNGGGYIFNIISRNNISGSKGGGVFAAPGEVHNSAIYNNTADKGGGFYSYFEPIVVNCTIVGNSAVTEGGGTFDNALSTNSLIINSIVYYNSAPANPNRSHGTYNYCCTTPDGTTGNGNISDEPKLLSALHIAAGSPCVGAGDSVYAVGVDIDGEPWENPPSIGCDEVYASALTGKLSVAISANKTLVQTNETMIFYADIDGKVSGNAWTFDDGSSQETDKFEINHSWNSINEYKIILTAFNDTFPGGISDTVSVQVVENANTHFVNVNNSGTPVSPYLSWATSATNIQDAIDVAANGETVLVADGVYNSGSRPAGSGLLNNRVLIDKAITVKSASGPENTFILGTPDPTTGGNGPDAVRCAYLVVGSDLSGFTLSNGYTQTTGDGNDPRGGSGALLRAGGIITNCIVEGNTASGYGAGVNCNHGGYVINCIIRNNSTGQKGGGVLSDGGETHNSLIYGNYSGDLGGGIHCYAPSIIENCTIIENSARNDGGGTCENGGTANSTLNNCIVYYNSALSNPNRSASVYNYCCTTPDGTSGTDNISDEPKLLSLSHIATDSPCVGAGNYADTYGVDIDGELWKNPPSIGCDEVYANAITGELSVAISTDKNYVQTNDTVTFYADIDGKLSGNTWTFGDGSPQETDEFKVTRSWSAVGEYKVVLTAVNGTFPAGVSNTISIFVVENANIHYVDIDNTGTPVSPYLSWATSATNIQDAIDVADIGEMVLVADGVYQSGSRQASAPLKNRVVIDKAITVQSVSGAKNTFIVGAPDPITLSNGSNAVRCAHLEVGALLTGFTLSNGYTLTTDDPNTHRGGGGVLLRIGGTISNCVVEGNFAAGHGGGICCNHAGNVFNSIVRNNSAAPGLGGGLVCENGEIRNCLISGNTAQQAGGMHFFTSGSAYNCTIVANIGLTNIGGVSFTGGGTLVNTIIYSNTSSTVSSDDNYGEGYTIGYSCSTPLPNGFGNISDYPEFDDFASRDFHLSEFSPCINAGDNIYAPLPVDLGGNVRIYDGTVDMGCYEFVPEPSMIFGLISLGLMILRRKQYLTPKTYISTSGFLVG